MSTYRHLVSGEAYSTPHEPGDPVSAAVPEEKLQEWLEAGVIELVPEVKAKKTKPREGTNSESQETAHGSSNGSSGRTA